MRGCFSLLRPGLEGAATQFWEGPCPGRVGRGAPSVTDEAPATVIEDLCVNTQPSPLAQHLQPERPWRSPTRPHPRRGLSVSYAFRAGLGPDPKCPGQTGFFPVITILWAWPSQGYRHTIKWDFSALIK